VSDHEVKIQLVHKFLSVGRLSDLGANFGQRPDY
jgi:hypothetical protein